MSVTALHHPGWLIGDPRGSTGTGYARLLPPSTALALRLQAAAPLTILHAASGMGKTCVLVGEFERLRSAGHRVVWIDGSLFSSVTDRAKAMVSDGLLDDADTVIVDDADRLGRAGLDAVAAATVNGSSPIRLILALRRIEGLGLARRVAHPQVSLVDGGLLAWSRRQLGGEWSTRLSAMQVAAIDSLAEGWPAPSLLLARALASGCNIDRQRTYLIDSLVASYIDDELLSAMPRRAMPGLLAAALSTTFDQGLLDRVGGPDPLAVSTLRADLGTLLMPIDGDWRFNRLLREHLLARFDQLSPERRRRLTQTVADWLSERGDVVGAARLVSRSGNGRQIADFTIRGGGLTLWLVKGYDYVRDLVAVAGKTLVAAEPRLQLLHCVVLLKEGRIGEAERLYHDAVRRLPADAEARRDAALVQATLTVYGCRVASSRDDSAFRLLDRAGTDPGWKTMLPTIRAIRHSQRAEFGAATAALVEATGHSVAAGITYNLLFLDFHRAGVELAQGALGLARTTLTRATRRWRNAYRDDRGAETVLNALLAQLDFEGGRRRQAVGHLRKSAHRFPHSEAWLDIYVAAYEPMLRLLAEEHGVAAVRAAILQATAQLHEQSLARIADLLFALGVCIEGEAMLRGDDVGVPVTDGDGILAATDPDQTWQEIEFRALARAYRALGEDDVAIARIELDRLLAFAEPRGLRRTELRALLLRCASLDRLAQCDLADVDFGRALVLAEETGMRRAFFEFGAASVRERLERGHARTLPPSLQAIVDDLNRTRWSRSTVVDRPLSKREGEVLDELGTGASDKTIGRRLGISEHAVRFHLKNVYVKLAVHNRQDAVTKMRERAPGFSSGSTME